MSFILSAEEMRRAETSAMDAGVPSFALMQNAGRRAAQIICNYYEPCRVHVLCGAGNNGGDGFITAHYLLQRGFDARVFLAVAPSVLKDDAARAASLWSGKIYPLNGDHQPAELIVDALFGTGFSRPLEGIAAKLAESVLAISAPVIALDLPSGIRCDDGQKSGAAFRAERTIAFGALKRGHVLMPGRLHCGIIDVAHIGIDDAIIKNLAPQCRLNEPSLWLEALPTLMPETHKYQRGHATICAGDPQKGGAAKLAALAALRIGAGLVTINAPQNWINVHAANLMSVMCEEGDAAVKLKDPRRTASLIGPGYGFAAEITRKHTLALLATGGHIILDADALTAFETAPDTLFAAIKSKSSGVAVLTPHDGEYQRLFPDLKDSSKIIRAQQAAQRSGVIIVLKGADTIIAAPDGTTAININAPAWLATAGTGDVLAGMITGALAQKGAPFETICAACFLHGRLGQRAGRGLIAEDLPDLIPETLQEIFDDKDAYNRR